MGLSDLVNPESEILIVKHRALNTPKTNFEEEIEKVFNELKGCTSGRGVVPVFEGDYGRIIGLDETKVVLAHPPAYDYFGLRGLVTQNEFEEMREKKKAVYFDDVLEKLSRLASRGLQFGLFLESKFNGADEEVNSIVMRQLKQAGISRVYFGSLFKKNLKKVRRANEATHSSFPVTRIKPWKLFAENVVEDQNGALGDFVTVGYPVDLAKSYEKPLSYSVVGDKDVVRKLSENPRVLGVGWSTNYKSLIKAIKEYVYV